MGRLYRQFLVLAALLASASTFAAEPAAKVFRVGFVYSTGDPRSPGPQVEFASIQSGVERSSAEDFP